MTITVSQVQLREGVYHARLHSAEPMQDAPSVALLHKGAALPDLEVTDRGHGYWDVICPLPATLLHDGVQTLALTTADGQRVLHSLAISAGAALEHDLVAEMALLRDEMQIVKRALREIVRNNATS